MREIKLRAWDNKKKKMENLIAHPFFEPLKITKEVVDLKTGKKVSMVATVKAEKDENHTKVSLVYEGYISKWEVSK